MREILSSLPFQVSHFHDVPRAVHCVICVHNRLPDQQGITYVAGIQYCQLISHDHNQKCLLVVVKKVKYFDL